MLPFRTEFVSPILILREFFILLFFFKIWALVWYSCRKYFVPSSSITTWQFRFRLSKVIIQHVETITKEKIMSVLLTELRTLAVLLWQIHVGISGQWTSLFSVYFKFCWFSSTLHCLHNTRNENTPKLMRRYERSFKDRHHNWFCVSPL